MQDFNITPQMVFDQTNGGLDIIEKYCPGAESAFKNKKHFKQREESTSSSFITFYEGIFWIKDFGDSKKAQTAIQLVMEEEGLGFKETLNLLVADFNLETNDTTAKQKSQYEYKQTDAADDENHGDIDFKVKDWDMKTLQTVFARTVWSRLKTIGRVAAENGQLEAKSDEVALRNATEICKKYGFLSLKNYSLVTRNKKAPGLIKHLYTATDTYPMMLWEAGKWQKIYKPKERDKKYRFLINGTKTRVMFGFAQASKKLQEEIDSELVLSKVDSEDPKAKEIQKKKLDEIIIVSGGSDAMNIAGCGYAPIWFDNEMFNLTSSEYAKLFSIAHRVYYLPDIDASGVREAIKMGKEYLNIELIFLPNNLSQEFDFRGNSCKDVRDFFRTLTPKNFENLIYDAKPLRFWEVSIKKVKGEEVLMKGQKQYQFTPDPELITNFLFRDGFCQLPMESDKRGYAIVHRDRNVVKQDVSFNIIQKHIKAFLKTDPVMRLVKHGARQLANAFNKSPNFGPSIMELLPELNLEFKSHAKSFQYMFFEQKAWKIFSDKIEVMKLEHCPVNVWEDERLTGNTKLAEPPFTITKKDDETYDIEIHEKDNMYLNFLIQTSRIHWQAELEIKLDELGKKEQEAYLKDHAFSIDGPLLDAEQIYEQKMVLISKLVAIGYLMHRHKDKSEAYCIWGTDHSGEQTTEESKSHGGTGKSIAFDMLTKYMKAHQLDGQQDDVMKDKFNLEGTTKHTKLIYVDDAGKYFQFERFFAIVTTFTMVWVKGTAGYVLQFPDSPKLAITSNLPPKKNDTSTRRRMWFLSFGNYYHKNVSGDFREDRTPKDDFNMELFGEDYPQTQWDKTHNLMARCIQNWLKFGKVNSIEDSIIKNILLNSMTLNFKSWADEMFHPDNGRRDTDVQRTPLFADYQKKTSYKVSPQVFMDRIGMWCEFYEFVLNPKQMRGKDGRIMKHVEKEELINGQFVRTPVFGQPNVFEKGTRECIYIDTGVLGAAQADSDALRDPDSGVPKELNAEEVDF